MEDQRIPFLFVGDSPSGFSGLGRILKDVALRTHEHLGDVLDVATLGLGQPPSPALPFQQFYAPFAQDWLLTDLPWVWNQHTRGREGILFLFWDVSRLMWMAYPDQCPDPQVKHFLMNFRGKKWIYPAVDGEGPTGGMPVLLKDALTKFDRVLNYTNFSARITGYPEVCTHGIDTDVFYPRPGAREWLRETFKVELEPGEKLIGIVATNQPRKDWALAFGALKILKQKGVKARVWIHTDVDIRHWSLPSLYVDFGLEPEMKVFVTPFGMDDEKMAMMYSACDVTLGIGPEGFGFPIAESLCCGTPCVTGEYGGQSDFVPSPWLVPPKAFRYESVYAVKRPVYEPWGFAKEVERIFRTKPLAHPVCSWADVWPSWEKWIREGL